jgi:RHS repeat-associated protein
MLIRWPRGHGHRCACRSPVGDGWRRLAKRSNTRGTTTVARGYDPDDNLTTVSNSATVTNIDWDPTSGLPQPTMMGAQRYVRGPDGLISSRSGLVDTNVSRDVYGSVIAPATIARGTSYSPFGAPAGADTWTPTVGYRGEIVVDSLTYLRARNYDTARGVFTTCDPLDGTAGSPVVANPYHYGSNNPLSNIDPTGMGNVGDGLFGFRTDFGVSRQTWGNQSLVNGQWVNNKVAAHEIVAQSMSQVRNTFFDDWGSDFVKTVKGEALGLTDMATGFAKQMSDPLAMLKNGAAIFDAAREDGLLAGWDEASKRLNPVDGIVRGFQAGYTAAMNNDPERAGRALLPAAAQTVMLIEGASQLAKGATAAGCHSFAAATLVVLADGTRKPISKIVVGDRVQSSDPVTGKTVVRAVTALHHNLDDDLVDLSVRDADGNVTVVHTTTRHRFWDDVRRQWVDAADLYPGERLHDLDGAVVIVEGVQASAGSQVMFDLTVNNVHNYYVEAGSVSLLVHNCGETVADDAVVVRGSLERRERPLMKRRLVFPMDRSELQQRARSASMVARSTTPPN